MFDFVRKHTRVLQFILLLLILPSFVIFGIQGYSGFSEDKSTVAEVGKVKITQAEWDNAHRNAVDRVRAQQPQVDIKAFDTPEFRKQTLDALVKQAVLAQAAQDQHIHVSDARLLREFATDPRFSALFTDGRFNKELLEAQGMSPNQLVAMLRQEMTLGQVLGSVQATGQTSLKANKAAVDALFQVREVQWLKLDVANYASRLQPTPQQLQAYYKDPANASWLQAPEKADVQYLVLDLDTLKQRVSVSEDDLRRAYAENQARYGIPEERRTSHILIQVAAAASADQKKAARAKIDGLLAQLRQNPAAFAELARKHSDDPGSAANGGDLEFSAREGMASKAYADAAFSLKKGEISGVVESEYGLHIIQLTEVRGGSVKPFEAVRAEIETDARKQLAQRQYAEAAERFTNAVYEQSDSLQPAADELKLQVLSRAGILREPGAADQGVLSNPRLLEALFNADNRSKGRNTEAIEVGPNQLVSARIVKHMPAALRSFDEAQPELRARWVAQAALKAARDDAAQKMSAWQKSPEQAAMPAAVQMSRKTIFNQPPAVLDAALRLPENTLPAWTVVELGKEGVALLKVNKVLPLDISPQELRETQGQFGAYWGRAEADAYYQALKRKYKVAYQNEGLKVMDAVKAKGKNATDAQKSAAAS